MAKGTPNRLGKAIRAAGVTRIPSKGEETFAFQMKVRGIPFYREFVFHPDRKFRLDFAFLVTAPDSATRKVAVEIDGGTRSYGRHSRHSGYQEDCRKANLAAVMGWLMLRYTTEMVMSGEADAQVARLLSDVEAGLM